MSPRALLVGSILLNIVFVTTLLWPKSSPSPHSITAIESTAPQETAFTSADPTLLTTSEQLLVIVIAGGTRGLVYPTYRAIWNGVADRVASQGVHVYLASMDESINSTLHIGHHIIFPGKDSLVPGVLNESLLAIEYVYAKQLPGSKAPHVLRTNLSSFWQFNKLLQWLRGRAGSLLAAFIGIHYELQFPAGAGVILSEDLCKRLLAMDRATLLSNPKPDDVVLGQVFRDRPIVPMKRTDLIYNTPFNIQHVLHKAPDIFHYRIKSDNELRDLGIMTWLYNEWYDVDKLIRNPKAFA